MASYNKFNTFVADIANKSHNLGSDQLRIALTNSAPSASDTSLQTEVSYTNLSGSNPTYITTTSSSQSSGTYKLILSDLVLTATGSVGPFRYIELYNNTASKVIGWYDYGSSISLANGDTFTIDFDGTNGVIQLA
jgi:hypothetical protein